MFRNLIDRVRGVRRVSDPVFGELQYYARGRVWEGSVRFAPTGRRIDVSLEAGPGGPTEAQRTMHVEFINRYGKMESSLLDAIRVHDSHAPDGLTLVAVELPARDADDGHLELTFESPTRGPIYCVELSRWSPSSVSGGHPRS